MKLTNRRGVFIGLVLAILVVFAVLSIYIMSSGSSEYNQTVMVAYRLKADAHAQAVLEEALAVLYDRINRPDDGNIEDDAGGSRGDPPWKAELFEAIVQAVDGGSGSIEVGTIAEYDLTMEGLGLIPESTTIIEAEDGEIEECTVSFEGFRRIWYSPSGFFNLNRGTVFYKDPYGKLDDPDYEYPYPNDYQGYAVIKIKVSYGSGPAYVERHIASTHDIKVVNQTPPARRFAVFQWSPVGDQDTMDSDLKRGGGLKVFPRDKARMYVRGPYAVDSYGITDGTGGDDAPGNTLSFWHGDDWHDWSLLPSSRAGIMKSAIFYNLRPMRPDDDSGWMFLVGLFNVGGLLNGLFDPGFAMVPDQAWFCATQDNSAENQRKAFCLVGETGDIQNFTGLHCKIEQDGSLSNQEASLGGTWPGTSDDMSNRYVKAVEGQLFQSASLARYDYWEIDVLFGPAIAKYSVDIENGGYHPYGFHYMPDARMSIGAAWVGFVCDVIMTVATVMTAGGATAAGAVIGNLTWQMIAGGIITGTITNMSLMGLQDRFELGPYDPAANANDWQYFFPPNHRDYIRTTSRWYYSLDELLSFSQEDPEEFPILLDGSVFVKDMGEQRWFTYLGKGSIVSENAAGDANYANPVIEGPIRAKVEPMTDHLNLMYLGCQENSWLGEDMLHVRPYDGDFTQLDACIYSIQGVAPAVESDPCEVEIFGNYMCGFFNKAKIPEGSSLRVNYNTNLYPDDEDAINAFHDGRWHNLSLSFRSSGWYDRKRPD